MTPLSVTLYGYKKRRQAAALQAMKLQFFIFGFLFTFLIHSAGATGTWEISGDGTYFSFQADRADASDIIRGLESMTGVSLNVKKLPAEPVSVKYINVTLDELMYRMGLEYVLEYTLNPESDDFELSSGWINYGDPAERLYKDFVEVNPDQDSGSQTEHKDGLIIFPPDVRKKLLVDKNADGSVYRAAFPVSPRIDGRTTDWPDGVPWQDVGAGSSIGVHAPTNDMDASFSMAGLADGTNMYIALAIRDDMKAVTNAARVPMQEDDSVRLFVSSPGGGEDMSVMINRHHVYKRRDSAGGPPVAAPVQYVSYHNGVKAVIMDDESGWRIEIAVPLDPLKANGGDVKTVGFDVQLNDFDASDPEGSILAWSTAAQLNNPFSGLGSFEFIDIR